MSPFTNGLVNTLMLPSAMRRIAFNLLLTKSLHRKKHSVRCLISLEFFDFLLVQNYYINRCGRRLSPARRATLEAAKQELRALYRRPRQDGEA